LKFWALILLSSELRRWSSENQEQRKTMQMRRKKSRFPLFFLRFLIKIIERWPSELGPWRSEAKITDFLAWFLLQKPVLCGIFFSVFRKKGARRKNTCGAKRGDSVPIFRANILSMQSRGEYSHILKRSRFFRPVLTYDVRFKCDLNPGWTTKNHKTIFCLNKVLTGFFWCVSIDI